MQNILKILAAVASLPFLGLGISALLNPGSMLDLFDLTPKGTFGFNTIRADLGGLLIGTGVMIWLGLWKKQILWFYAAILINALLLFGRLVSTVLDGWSNAAIPAIGVEVFAIIVLSLNIMLDRR